MTRRARRTTNYELNLQIKNEDFVRTPRDSQRSWLLNRLLKETSDELEHLDKCTKQFITGSDEVHEYQDRTQKILSDREIMEDWQIPVMQAMADIVTKSCGDILEIGFGRGIGSDFIQANDIRSHTIIECNDSIVARYHEWRKGYPQRDIRLLHGLWQDVIPGAGTFDGIFFHTYPLNESDFVDQVVNRSTFAEHFFDVAAKHLKPGGSFSYLTNESESISRAHQRALLRNFNSFSLSRLDDLEVPEDTSDALWTNSILIVEVIK